MNWRNPSSIVVSQMKAASIYMAGNAESRNPRGLVACIKVRQSNAQRRSGAMR
jgi:hypothetical protein